MQESFSCLGNGSNSIHLPGGRTTIREKLLYSFSSSERLIQQILQEAGLPIGGKDFSPYVMLEVHYNNPAKREGNKTPLFIRFHNQ